MLLEVRPPSLGVRRNCERRESFPDARDTRASPEEAHRWDNLAPCGAPDVDCYASFPHLFKSWRGGIHAYPEHSRGTHAWRPHAGLSNHDVESTGLLFSGTTEARRDCKRMDTHRERRQFDV